MSMVFICTVILFSDIYFDIHRQLFELIEYIEVE